MSSRTLPTAKPDQWVSDSSNEWSFVANLILDSYLQEYSQRADNQGKKLVILNLYAGSGNIDWDDKKYLSPALIGLHLDAHHKSVLLEQDQDLFESLEARIGRDYPGADVELLPSSPNMQVERIVSLLEPYASNDEFQILCLATPRSLELKFFTTAALAKLPMDFVMLHRLPDSGYRGPRGFINKNLERISEYLELMEWAAILDQPQYDLDSLTRLLADLYFVQMKNLNYPDLDLRHVIKMGKKNQEYYVSYYSHQSWAHEAYVNANQVLENQLKLLV